MGLPIFSPHPILLPKCSPGNHFLTLCPPHSKAGPPTQVHVNGPRPLGVGHVLIDGIEDLLLDLCDGVTVQHLHWDLRTVLIVGVDAVQDL